MKAIPQNILDEIALSREEYDLITDRLGREPNPLELGMFGALWSEHCGYKHSKRLLEFFPSTGPKVLFPPGSENAGAIDIGDGLAVVFKIESHNHPSAIEPLQGAATGVGGIVRDILAMGARPIALLNSLRFGPLDESNNRHLVKGVVSGISWYGNCIGVPDVGGEIFFSESYSGNPIVNALCVGLVEKDKLIRATVGEPGNLLLLVGSGTGRDGIHGASGLASRTFDDEREMRPAVQVGNPFLEKVLIEACLEVATFDGLVGMQDLGAAGLTSSAVECAEKGGNGIKIDVSKVSRREQGMNPYEIMLSESQERMLLIIKPGEKDRLNDMLAKWDLTAMEIGHVLPESNVEVYDGLKKEASLPVEILTHPKLYRLKGRMPEASRKLRKFPLSNLKPLEISSNQILLSLLKSPNIASKAMIYRQYDHQVQTNTLQKPGTSDAALVRIKGTQKALALSTDGNSRFCYLDPYRGGMIAVAEACRNVSCVGAVPVALTDCLNFGNPENPEIYYQLEWAIRGISKACKVLGVPVVGGNVSLYNESRGNPIDPTPVIGVLGVLEELARATDLAFKDTGDLVVMLGDSGINGRVRDLAGSEYIKLFYGLVAGRPEIDLKMEAKVQLLCRRAIDQGLIQSAHDCSEGGLAVTIAESSIASGLGFISSIDMSGRHDAALFGEAQSRIVVSVKPQNFEAIWNMANDIEVPIVELGRVHGSAFRLVDIDLPVKCLEEAWKQGIDWPGIVGQT
ncbi:MAG: phosphoribosylformylglycinamidine synthase II [Dehalococcoidia bacterium]|nr:phosphoribosylformylglycinamidine synthase II [Dehalococcoidia bacterium]